MGDRFVAFGLPGSADLTGILPDGKRLEIEVKRPLGLLTLAQKNFGDMIEKFGGVYIVAHSASEVEKKLEALGY